MLKLMILASPFQLRVFCDFMIRFLTPLSSCCCAMLFTLSLNLLSQKCNQIHLGLSSSLQQVPFGAHWNLFLSDMG